MFANVKDITGKKFGRLMVIKPTKRRRQRTVVWKCSCNCGNIVFVKGTSLRNGDTKSCGCLRIEKAKLNKGVLRGGKNIVGQRFGLLLVLRDTEKRSFNNIVWECLCDCGRIIEIKSSSIRSGRTKSCGCLAMVSRFMYGIKMDFQKIPIEMREFIVSYYELRKAIKQAS